MKSRGGGMNRRLSIGRDGQVPVRFQTQYTNPPIIANMATTAAKPAELVAAISTISTISGITTQYINASLQP